MDRSITPQEITAIESHRMMIFNLQQLIADSVSYIAATAQLTEDEQPLLREFISYKIQDPLEFVSRLNIQLDRNKYGQEENQEVQESTGKSQQAQGRSGGKGTSQNIEDGVPDWGDDGEEN